ncbi:MAG: N-acetylmuramoyl-L-alanine amidase [Elusimicrobia bacterium]|nr:N-acetylmuramoyl-L-alanine amidase [Elusimicrobiota bacterium]
MKKTFLLLFWGLAIATPQASALHEPGGVEPVFPDSPVAGIVILDPGHGGEDVGATAKGHSESEKEIALAVAKKIKERLEMTGSPPVRLTRDSDVYLRLDERLPSESAEGALFVSVHVNQVPSKKAKGVRIFSFGKNPRHGWDAPVLHRPIPLPPPPREIALESARLAQAMIRSLHAQGFSDASADVASFYVLKNPAMPSVLVELGFISNPKEAARLVDPSYQERLAEALAVSLKSYRLQQVSPGSLALGR